MIQGHLDVPLDDVGQAQADAVARALAPARPAVVVSSDLARARETAARVAERAGVALRLDARLREVHLGTWQGLTTAQVRERFPEEHAAWVAGRDVARGSGERYADAAVRAVACLRELLPSVPAGGTLVAVTHGGTAGATVATLLELGVEGRARLAPLGNTCWSVLVEAGRGWRLERHNAGLGPLVGPANGLVDVGRDVRAGSEPSPDVEPVR